MSDRKLATIRVISQLKPIKGADLIEVAVIDGWEVVIKKGEFNIGDLCVYFGIDSWIPTELAPFLSKGKVTKSGTTVTLTAVQVTDLVKYVPKNSNFVDFDEVEGSSEVSDEEIPF